MRVSFLFISVNLRCLSFHSRKRGKRNTKAGFAAAPITGDRGLMSFPRFFFLRVTSLRMRFLCCREIVHKLICKSFSYFFQFTSNIQVFLCWFPLAHRFVSFSFELAKNKTGDKPKPFCQNRRFWCFLLSDQMPELLGYKNVMIQILQ